jgi:hypothetical protein
MVLFVDNTLNSLATMRKKNMLSQVFLYFFEIAKKITMKILLHISMFLTKNTIILLGLIKIKLAHQFFSSNKFF